MTIVNQNHRLVAKHPGSDGGDLHDNGTGQEVHGGDRHATQRTSPGVGTAGYDPDTEVHGEELLEPNQGIGSRNKQPDPRSLAYGEGHPLQGQPMPVSFLGIEGAQLMDGRSIPERTLSTITERIFADAEKYGIDLEAMPDNITRQIESAFNRYAKMDAMAGVRVAGDFPSWLTNATSGVGDRLDEFIEYDDLGWSWKEGAGTRLAEHDRFYEHWHGILYNVAAEAKMSFSRVIAAGSAISPSTAAEQNLEYTKNLVKIVNDDPVINEAAVTGAKDVEAGDIARALDAAADAKLNPIYTENHKAVKANPELLGKPRLYTARMAGKNKALIGTEYHPEEGSAAWNTAQDLKAGAEMLRSGDKVNLLDLPSEAAARVAHWMRQADPDEKLRPHAMGAGYGVQSYSFYATAIDVLAGNITPDEALKGIKTRSFHNNILSPDAPNQITIDFHTMNAAAMALGSDKNTDLTGRALHGIELGIRPYVADAFRVALGRVEGNPWGVDSLARLQEVVWAEWKRGLAEAGEGSRQWKDSFGQTYDLIDVASKTQAEFAAEEDDEEVPIAAMAKARSYDDGLLAPMVPGGDPDPDDDDAVDDQAFAALTLSEVLDRYAERVLSVEKRLSHRFGNRDKRLNELVRRLKRKRRYRRNPVEKHYGPGPHPGTGTTQEEAHGRGARGTSANQRIGALKEQGGFTIDEETGDVPTEGWAVALPGHEERTPLSKLTPDWVRRYRARHAKALKPKEALWGGWVESVDGQDYVFLDVSIVLPPKEKKRALALGKAYRQLAIFNLATFEEYDPLTGKAVA